MAPANIRHLCTDVSIHTEADLALLEVVGRLFLRKLKILAVSDLHLSVLHQLTHEPLADWFLVSDGERRRIFRRPDLRSRLRTFHTGEPPAHRRWVLAFTRRKMVSCLRFLPHSSQIGSRTYPIGVDCDRWCCSYAKLRVTERPQRNCCSSGTFTARQ